MTKSKAIGDILFSIGLIIVATMVIRDVAKIPSSIRSPWIRLFSKGHLHDYHWPGLFDPCQNTLGNAKGKLSGEDPPSKRKNMALQHPFSINYRLCGSNRLSVCPFFGPDRSFLDHNYQCAGKFPARCSTSVSHRGSNYGCRLRDRLHAYTNHGSPPFLRRKGLHDVQ